TWRLTLPSYPGEDTWFFNPLAWQLLFISGFIWGVRIKAGEAIPYHPVVFWCACLYAALAFIWVQVSIWDLFPKSLMANPLWSISKTYLSPLRLLHVLALAYVIGMSPVAGWLKRIPVTNFVVQMGQHALPVFCAGSLLSMALLIAREKFGGGILVDVSIVAIGVALQAVLAWFLAWQARSPAGQVGSAAAGGFMAGPPAVMPPPLPPLSR
ncbi:MAG TPA: OpgC domain-containing protein, partial [Hyphomicrobiaceae bacterium]|nr:OpgC domain-containing protein [Hyphomicrobiaceae bacterium]